MGYLERMKETEVNILNYINGICEKNDLKYYLYFGTLIGAVRHKGFIPWDDDIDIAMTREDYEKFKKILRENSHEDFTLLDYDGKEDYPFIFPKVIYNKSELKENFLKHVDFKYGVYVDIFILEGLPKSEFKRKYLALRYRYLYTLVRYYYYSPEKLSGILRRLQPLFKNIINVKRVEHKIATLYSKYKTQECEDWRLQLDFMSSEYVKKEYFQEGVFLEFEGAKYRCPKNYDRCLTIKYGEYMKLPKEEERVSNHTFHKLVIEKESFEVK